MNIALTSLYLPSGSKIGSGYQAHYMAQAMARRGHGVTVFSPCPRPEDALYQHVAVDPGRRWRTFGFAFALRRIDFSAFDILHAHGDDYWMLGRRRPAHVRTMHGSCFAEAANVSGLKEKLRMLLLGCSEVLATLVADRTVCVSENTRRYYPWLKTVLYNGVDTAAFHPGAAKEDRPTILFVGTYRNRKRGQLLMHAFEQTIRPAVPDAQLWMVCSDAPEATGVTVLGRLSLDELADRYRRAWVFCLPSTYEGFGVPYIEAMASGTPVVATPNVGAVEVLDRGHFGILCEDRDLGRRLLEVLGSAAERELFTAAGLDRARAFSWDVIAEQYERIYRQLIAERGNRPAAATVGAV